jgi:hypothetical protein
MKIAVFWVVAMIIALMMEAARTSETLVNFYQTTRCYNPEDSNLLISFVSDGASVMLGRKSGVAKLFLEDFPNAIVWHCACHRLKLSVSDAVDEVVGLNHLHIFSNELCSLYHRSPKNQDDLITCVQSLHCQLLKIGRVFSVRWVTSSYRTVKAIWISYKALWEHFREASADDSRSSADMRS